MRNWKLPINVMRYCNSRALYAAVDNRFAGHVTISLHQSHNKYVNKIVTLKQI